MGELSTDISPCALFADTLLLIHRLNADDPTTPAYGHPWEK